MVQNGWNSHFKKIYCNNVEYSRVSCLCWGPKNISSDGLAVVVAAVVVAIVAGFSQLVQS